jgi:hypothetical protein
LRTWHTPELLSRCEIRGAWRPPRSAGIGSARCTCGGARCRRRC